MSRGRLAMLAAALATVGGTLLPPGPVGRSTAYRNWPPRPGPHGMPAVRAARKRRNVQRHRRAAR